MFVLLLTLFALACIITVAGLLLSPWNQLLPPSQRTTAYPEYRRVAVRRSPGQRATSTSRQVPRRRTSAAEDWRPRTTYNAEDSASRYRNRYKKRGGLWSNPVLAVLAPWLGGLLILLALFIGGLYGLRTLLPTNAVFLTENWPDAAIAAPSSANNNGSGVAQTFPGIIGASKALKRIDQLDPAQYYTLQDYKTWAYSTCSAASMTEIINAYGHNYRIADILKVEAGLNEITPALGLVEAHGIDRTVARFGFQTYWPPSPSLDEIIQIANSGRPVMVGFPPARWSGGHLLVVIGGNSNSVYVADSSALNMQVFTHANFLKYWAGFAVVITPDKPAAALIGPLSAPLARSPLNASKSLVRINQLDPRQYASVQDYQTWAYVTGSTASMAEVINAYGHHYRIADILKVQRSVHMISPTLGLLAPQGIALTVARFGFQGQMMSYPSLAALLKLANSGTPVIVGFPPSRWPGGHLLVVTGGNGTTVYVADSSGQNITSFTVHDFLKYWMGFAAVVTPK
jgi:predicted double-glycine peptidase